MTIDRLHTRAEQHYAPSPYTPPTAPTGVVSEPEDRQMLSPAATDFISALLAAGWMPTEGPGQSGNAFRPHEDGGLTLRLPTGTDETLLLEAEPRRRADGTTLPTWRAEIFWDLPVAILTAVVAAHTAEDAPATEPGELLALAGWIRSPLRSREWATPERDRELNHIDDTPQGSATWCIQRWDLGYLEGLAIAASCGTPANVIAAFALTNTD